MTHAVLSVGKFVHVILLRTNTLLDLSLNLILNLFLASITLAPLHTHIIKHKKLEIRTQHTVSSSVCLHRLGP